MGYQESKIKDFLQKLSSTESMPGGGVAASLVGAEGISLGLKVCNLSLGKEKYKKQENLIKESIADLEEIRDKILDLMDEDAENFKAIEDVYKMPKETEEERNKRREALENACKKCCDTPVKLINEAARAATIIIRLIGNTNESAASDLKIGLTFLFATIHSSWENVEINLKFIKDEEFKKPLMRLKEKITKFMESTK